jgi:hypothetical protein
MSSPEKKRTLVGLVPSRLAADSDRHRLSWAPDDSHERGVRQALDWQQSAGNAVFWEMGAATRGASEAMVYGLAGLMASAGEQLGLAHAAGVEVDLWDGIRDASDPDPEHEMCMRAMAESQMLFVIGTAHTVANVAVRALALRPKLREELARMLKYTSTSPSFDPFSDARADWVSLNAATCQALQAAAEADHVEEVVQLVAPVVAFGTGSTWDALQDRRGQDFHRWRPQTHGIEGVPRASPWERDGSSKRLNGGSIHYEEARGLADQVARVARTAMLDLVEAMDAFRTRWPAASQHLGGPKFTTPGS